MTVIALALLACTGDDDGPTYTGETGDTYIPWPDDTGETGTDADGDGWTVEEGDCDDDNIYVHPGWEESSADGNADDGIDNDCDGRTDEDFRGMVVAQWGDGTTPARIVEVDAFGETEREIMCDDAGIIPYWLDTNLDGTGWATVSLGANDTRDEQLAVWEIAGDGTVSLIADFSDSEVYENGIYGFATHPDGYYLVAAVDGIYAVESTGSITKVFSVDIETEMLIFDIDVDPLSGDIGVFGLYGGFAILDANLAGGVLKTFNPDGAEYSIWSGDHFDEGGWYAGGQDIDGWAVFRFNENDNDWVRKASFNQDWTPHFMAVDSVYGDYYVSSTDATYPIVWKIPADGGNPAQWFQSPYNVYQYQLWGLYTRY